MNKWLRRKCNSLGYGVQSPNDFYFVQHVLLEELPYYNYEIIEKVGRERHGQVPSYPNITNKLLFRLANYLHPDTIIEVGAGTSSLSLSLACPSAQCIAITNSKECHEELQHLLPLHTRVKKGDEMELFQQFLQEKGTIGMLHIAHTTRHQEILDHALPYVTDRTLIVIEGIGSSKEKYAWWESLQNNPQIGITYDLEDIGLIFFNRSRHKESYWIKLRK